MKKTLKCIKEYLTKIDLGKNKFNTLELVLIFIMALTFGILIGEMLFSNGTKSNLLTQKTGSNTEQITNIYNTLIDEYIDKIDEDDLKEAAIEGMLNLLGDNYSLYYNEDESKDLQEQLKGTFYGIGAEVYQEENGLVTVYNVFEGTPASEAGLKVGDQYLKINGQDVTGKTIDEIAEMIKGKNNKQIILTIKRGEQEKQLKLTTTKIEIPSVYSDIISKENIKIGYIKITTFAQNTDEQFSKHLNNIENHNITNLIIDLRSNKGGELETVINIASNFLSKKDVIVQTVSKGKVTKKYSTRNNDKKYNIVVLINGQSASGAEVLAAALNENYGAPLVGTTTYGKGSVQKAKTLADGSMIKYTIETWRTGKGKQINGAGINPTINVEMSSKYYETLNSDDDNQLQKAIQTTIDN